MTVAVVQKEGKWQKYFHRKIVDFCLHRETSRVNAADQKCVDVRESLNRGDGSEKRMGMAATITENP
jgi:hypothetical protein